MAPGGRRRGAGMQSHAYCLSAFIADLSARKTTSFSNLCSSPTWWLWRSGCTRSHSELGRETLQRQWYFVLRHGRVGRCQVCQEHKSNHLLKYIQNTHSAGWSSPVARQAHNLKAAGSNPAPATKFPRKYINLSIISDVRIFASWLRLLAEDRST